MSIWKPVPGFYPYLISNQGQIKRLAIPDRRGWQQKERVLKQVARSDGYRQITLINENGERVGWLVHRLLLTVFKRPAKSDKELALHRNDCKTDNYLGNLRWGSHSDNMADAIKHGIHGKGSRTAKRISKKLKGRTSPTLGMKFGPETSLRHKLARLGKKRGPYKRRVR